MVCDIFQEICDAFETTEEAEKIKKATKKTSFTRSDATRIHRGKELFIQIRQGVLSRANSNHSIICQIKNQYFIYALSRDSFS